MGACAGADGEVQLLRGCQKKAVEGLNHEATKDAWRLSLLSLVTADVGLDFDLLELKPKVKMLIMKLQ